MPRHDRASLASHQRVPKNGIQVRAEELVRLHDALESAYAARDGTADRDRAWRDAAAAFRAACDAFYEPFTGLGRRIREGDRAAIDDAVRFLEADPWCFRSGYVKEELMTALANAPLPGDVLPRLRAVIIHRVTHREPRLLRPTGRLAASVCNDELALQLSDLLVAGGDEQRHDAEAVLRAVEHKRRTLAGQSARSKPGEPGEESSKASP
ncbi:MAG: hypothetical protein KY439_03820 [Actinobacteria bacterium]|nr:hypothetical protein [Actinomycetota bacterium]